MAYGLRYISNFYNLHGKLVSVKLSQKDYGSGEEGILVTEDEQWLITEEGDPIEIVVESSSYTNIRTQSVEITVNYQNDLTPVVGTGAKIVIVNTGDFGDFNDLLTAYEREFKCVIEWDGEVVFEGFVVCDLNEQTALDWSIITIHATNYLHRLEDAYPTEVENINETSSLIDIIQDALGLTDLDYELYVNSTLWESQMIEFGTWLAQTYVDNSVFFKNPIEYDDAYTMLNKILLPFNAFLYSFGQRWVIERYENLTRVGDWALYEVGSSGWTETGSLREMYNKQDGDFEYVNPSQILSYGSGLNTLIINKRDRLLETLVFNNFSTSMSETSQTYPMAATLTKNTWYVHEDASDLEVGNNFRDIDTYFKWKMDDLTTPELKGIYYRFSLQFNSGFPTYNPNDLTVTFKMSAQMTLSAQQAIKVRYFIRVDGGDATNKFLYDNDGVLALDNSAQIFEAEFDPTTGEPTFKVDHIWKLSDIQSDLGNPATQDFIIGFLPIYFESNGNDPGVGEYIQENYIGDIKIKIDAEAIDNQTTATINKGFLKTETVELDLFDLDNLNYPNGLWYNGLTKTANWDAEGDSAYEDLATIFIKNRFKKLAKPIKTLKGSIICDKYLKPFSILTDDNLVEDTGETSGSIIEFILNKYTWDLVYGKYTIEAEEFKNNDLTLI